MRTVQQRTQPHEVKKQFFPEYVQVGLRIKEGVEGVPELNKKPDQRSLKYLFQILGVQILCLGSTDLRVKGKFRVIEI